MLVVVEEVPKHFSNSFPPFFYVSCEVDIRNLLIYSQNTFFVCPFPYLLPCFLLIGDCNHIEFCGWEFFILVFSLQLICSFVSYIFLKTDYIKKPNQTSFIASKKKYLTLTCLCNRRLNCFNIFKSQTQQPFSIQHLQT